MNNEEYTKTQVVSTIVVSITIVLSLFGYAIYNEQQEAIRAHEQRYQIKTSSSTFIGKDLYTYRDSVTFFNVETGERTMLRDAQISYKPINNENK